MYLLTFAMFVIGILAVYTQILGVEAARLYQNQTNYAQSLIYWHQAGLSLASGVIAGTAFPSIAVGGCNLTATPWAGSPATCITGGNIASPGVAAVITGGPYTYTGTTPPSSVRVYPYLPVGYAIGTYPWKSIAFQNGTSYYVFTFIDPPAAAANGFISVENGTQLGITQSDFFQQIQNTGLSNMAYGYVNGAHTLITSSTYNGAPITYALPTAAGILANSFGIISYVNPCGGC